MSDFAKVYERTAARRARLVELHAVYGLVLYFNTFHILAADIKDTVDIGLEECRGIVMGNRLHLAFIKHKSRF